MIDGFSEAVRELGNVRSSALLDPHFYSGGETSFPTLFQHVARERGRGTISIIVSDLVQSGSTGDQRALLTALQEVTRSGPEIQLLAFRSAFRGAYFVEGRRTQRPRLELSLDGSSIERSRPFYVLIIADSREDLARVRAYLRPQVDGVSETQLPLEFDATGPALNVESIEFAPPPARASVVWNSYAETRKLAGARSGGPSRFVLSFLEVAPPVTEAESLRLRLKVRRSPNEGEIRSAEGLQLAIRRCSFRARQPTPIEPGEISWEALMPGKDLLEVIFDFPRPNPRTWDAYQIRIAPGPGNLQPPLWALDWSTLDDSTERNGSRTLKLEVFIDTLIRSIKEKVPFSEQYILLGRGE